MLALMCAQKAVHVQAAPLFIFINVDGIYMADSAGQQREVAAVYRQRRAHVEEMTLAGATQPCSALDSRGRSTAPRHSANQAQVICSCSI